MRAERTPTTRSRGAGRRLASTPWTTRMDAARTVGLCLLAGGALGCGGILGPGGDCETAFGLEACLSALEAAPNTDVVATIGNGTSDAVRLDTCSIQLIGRPDPAQPFEPTYDPTRRCGPDVTHEEILAASLTIQPGERLAVDLRIPAGLFQGQYRYRFWFLDDEGALLFAEPPSPRPIGRTAVADSSSFLRSPGTPAGFSRPGGHPDRSGGDSCARSARPRTSPSWPR